MKKNKLSQKELNAVSTLLTNSAIMTKRAIYEGYMTQEEENEAWQRAELYMSALTKIIIMNTEDNK